MSDRYVTPVPLPSDYQRELLTITNEECFEIVSELIQVLGMIAKRSSKMHRFGVTELKNKQQLSEEIGDLLAMIPLLGAANLIDADIVEAQVPKKEAKLKKYLQHQ
jgi:NTP pyrophosphatase (non-canonical NTP hydrolase)